MVFVTEFDSIDQAQRHQANQAQRAQATEQSATLTNPRPPKLGHSRLSQSNQTQFLLDQVDPAAPEPSRSIGVARPLALELARSRRPPTADKVVPLHLGRPAVRVQADPASELALSFSDKSKLPWRLRLLNQVQQGSTLVTGLLFTGALIAYGSTVYIDKSAGRALLQLDTLQSESQQLTSANEAIKQSLAEQAEQAGSGLEPYDPGDALFLSPEPKRALHPGEKTPAKMPRPLGY